ncbi:MAG: hypothetical protein HOY79_05760 [Streptomyces sp.]|nr:hypothetical protein [Streptomyces sp.]
MSQGGMRRVRDMDLRLAAAMAEVEGLYAVLSQARSSRHREQARADLARAAARLADLAAVPLQERQATAVVTRSRWGRRRVLARRGARWVGARFGPG